MSRRDDDLTPLLLLGLGLWIFEKMQEPVQHAVTVIQKGGARLFELTHPYEKDHVRDLPGKPWTRSQLIELAQRAGFPDPRLAVAVALAESGGAPNALQATDREYSVGLWQINMRAHPGYTREELADPEQNANAAYRISHGGTDWSPWSTYRNGRYRGFM